MKLPQPHLIQAEERPAIETQLERHILARMNIRGYAKMDITRVFSRADGTMAYRVNIFSDGPTKLMWDRRMTMSLFLLLNNNGAVVASTPHIPALLDRKSGVLVRI